MGGNVDTGTQTSGLSNPAMQAAATTIGNQLNTQLKAGVKPFTGSLVPDLSSQTMGGVNALTNNPNTAAYGQGITNAIAQQADIAAGNFGADPVRQRIIDDVSTNLGATLQGSGRFGSGSHEQALMDQVGGSLAQYDYGRQQQALQNLPGLYQASNMPASASLQAGQLMDQYNTAKAQDAARIFDATQNAGWNTLQRGSAIFGGTAPVSGTTTTESLPWWRAGLGIGSTALGFM